MTEHDDVQKDQPMPEDVAKEPTDETADDTTDASPPETPSENAEDMLPPPTLEQLGMQLYYQAMAAMGKLPSPLSGKIEISKPRARYTIDMLTLVFEKTEGHRTEEETQALGRMLYELRMAFVQVQGGG